MRDGARDGERNEARDGTRNEARDGGASGGERNDVGNDASGRERDGASDARGFDQGHAAAGMGPAEGQGPGAMIPMYEPGRARGGGGRSWIGPRGPGLWYGGLAVLGVVLVGVMIVLTLPAPARQTTRRVLPAPSATPAAAASPTVQPPLPVTAFGLPPFSGWAAAYLDADGAVHIAPLDGSGDFQGPVLQLNTAETTNGVGAWVSADTADAHTSIAVAPNGRYLAYINAAPLPLGVGVAPPSGPLALINLVPDANQLNGWTAISLGDATVTHIAGWSPNSVYVAVDATVNGVHGIYIVAAGSAKLQLVPGTDDQGMLSGSHAIGWLDNTHLLLMTTGAGTALPPVAQASVPGGRSGAALAARFTAPRSPESSNGDRPLATVDVSSEAAYEITRVPAGAVVALAPDGTEIEAYSGCQTGCPPLAPEVVDTATGQTRALPNSAGSLLLQGIALWQPGAPMLAVTITGQGPPRQWRVNLVNTQADTGEFLQSPAYAIGWSPDGKRLLLGDTSDIGEGGGQTTVTVTAMPLDGDTFTLAHPMAAFIGFVKTA